MAVVRKSWCALVFVLALGWTGCVRKDAPPTPNIPSTPRAASDGRNVVLVTIDGLRRQEVLYGAEPRLLGDNEKLRARFWRDTAQARQQSLMPFFWNTLIERGQVFGIGTEVGAQVSNSIRVSYPGYSEMLTGLADPRIDGNKVGANPNPTVLEWLNQKPGFAGRVGLVGSWAVFHDIVRSATSGLFVNAGWQPLKLASSVETDQQRRQVLNELMTTTTRQWDGVRFDSFTFRVAMEYLQQVQPRALHLALGEPDDWAHDGQYDRYLTAIRRCDDLIADLWQRLQADPVYRDNTTLILTVDHGRGREPEDWTTHNRDTPGSEEIWIAVMGPDTPAQGLRRAEPPVVLAQVAATMAAAVGQDYAAAFASPAVAPVLPGVLQPASPEPTQP